MTHLRYAAVVAALVLCGLAGASASTYAELPAAETDDAIMASPADVQDMLAWTDEAFGGTARTTVPGRVVLKVLRQDHSVLQFGKSCIDTPIVIGTKSFEHGLGTHANSEIAVTVPKGAKAFHAEIGVDNNFNTQGKNGSVEFYVVIDGKEVFRSATLHGGDAPVPVDVPIAEGVGQIMLKVDTTADGASCDQGDWADARFEMGDGSVRWLDDNQSKLLFLGANVPFSFTYNGVSSREFLGTWKREAKSGEQADRIVDTIRWTDPVTALSVSAIVTSYKRYPAVDWVLHFDNGGSKDTPIIEDIQALDVNLRTGYAQTAAHVHQLEGDACGENSFTPKTRAIAAKESYVIAPTGGRPSSISAFPFYNVQYGDSGLITAVGWTGQWAAKFDRAENGPMRMRSGMELTHLLLHPGESIRTPRIVMLAWKGDRQRAQNQWRRLMLFKYAPRLDGKIAQLPTALQTFDRYRLRPGWATEAGQVQAAQTAKALGCNTYWFDAAWFPGDFPDGVGNWFAKPQEFPNGLKPVGDVCRENGMRFILWFEPERVAPNTQIAKEHPEFVLGNGNGGLFNLGDPAARRWLTDLLSKRITEYGITFYRNDFNMDPLSFWRANDAPDRQGMSEIRYVEGLYAMWDELRATHPGLLIDNCSSGGRRIDIEMCSRSLPLWRSDTSCSPGHPEWNQLQSSALSQFVPLHTACAWAPVTTEVRSAATGGLLCQFAYLDDGFPMDRAKALIEEAKISEPYWYGDFYPLTSPATASDNFVTYQLHRPDLDAGIVLAFRHRECRMFGAILGINAVRPDGKYSVEFIDDALVSTEQTMTGQDLATNLGLRVAEGGGSLLVRYRPADAK
ncbi:MAG: NPCBM/NEW2 domain-containing protein [Candidatus Hydrogenedentales bacterium]|jgi:alpha-galactosidase